MKINLINRRLWLFIWVGIVLLHLLTLLRYPPPFVDEAWLVSRAWAFKETGHQYGPLDAGLGEVLFPGIWTINQWLITALQSLVLRFFPQPELLPLRILSLVEGFGLLLVSYWTAFRLGGKPVAICSTLLLAISRIFFHTAHMVRYDILATFIGYSALAIVVNDRRCRLWVGLAAGILVGLAVETHLNSIIFFPAIVVYYLAEYRGVIFRKPGIWGFILGSSLGVIFYLFLHIFPYPDTYFKVNALLFSHTQSPPLFSLNVLEVLKGFSNVLFLLLLGSGPLLLLGLLAVPLLIRQKTREGIELLAINSTLWLGAALIIPNTMGHYAIYLAPAFFWLVAGFFLYYSRQPWRGRFWDYVSRGIVWGVIIGSLVLCIELLLPNGYESYRQAQKKVDATILAGDTIMGPQVYWLGLYEHRYYSWELLFLYPRFYSGKNLEDAMRYYRPDIFIIDGNMEPYINDTVDPSDRWYHYRVSRNELFSFLESHAELVSEPDDVSYYGSSVQVYRVMWNP